MLKSPPLPEEEMEKPVPTTYILIFVTKKRWKTFKFTQKENLPRDQDCEFRYILANFTYQRIYWLLVHIDLIFKVR